uniref:Uncharacterized protein n=1 Tax=Nelumbo nucifera TaxID=4432 RepID=A0A822ZRF6_NELNU|nr:TPA_asm: hypothetical protein HUJ06_002638 [Nelumbo nucifera]
MSPCTSICSFSVGPLTTDAPVANFFPSFFEASLSLTPKRSSPFTTVTHFRLLRTIFSITTSCFSFFFIFPPGSRFTSCLDVEVPPEGAAVVVPSPPLEEIPTDLSCSETLSASLSLLSLRRSGYSSGAFSINHGLHFSKSGPNSQYSAGRSSL